MISRNEKRNLNQDGQRLAERHNRMIIVLAIVSAQYHKLLVAFERRLYALYTMRHLLLQIPFFELDFVRHIINGKREEIHREAHGENRRRNAEIIEF